MGTEAHHSKTRRGVGEPSFRSFCRHIQSPDERNPIARTRGRRDQAGRDVQGIAKTPCSSGPVRWRTLLMRSTSNGLARKNAQRDVRWHYALFGSTWPDGLPGSDKQEGINPAPPKRAKQKSKTPADNTLSRPECGLPLRVVLRLPRTPPPHHQRSPEPVVPAAPPLAERSCAPPCDHPPATAKGPLNQLSSLWPFPILWAQQGYK